MTSSLALEDFDREKPRYAIQLSGEIDQLESFDAFLCPPSSVADARDLATALLAERQSIAEIVLDRTGEAKAARGASVDELVNQLTIREDTALTGIRRLLVVDDCVASGTTVEAILKKLHDRGLPCDCEVVIACYVRMGESGKQAG